MLKTLKTIEDRKNLIKSLSNDKSFHDLMTSYIVISQDIQALDIKIKSQHSLMKNMDEISNSKDFSLLTYEALATLRKQQRFVKNMILKRCLLDIDLFTDTAAGGSSLYEKIEMVFLLNIQPFINLNLPKNNFNNKELQLFVTALLNVNFIENN